MTTWNVPEQDSRSPPCPWRRGAKVWIPGQAGSREVERPYPAGICRRAADHTQTHASQCDSGAFASLVPEKTSVGSLVIRSLLLVPVSWVMAAITGAAVRSGRRPQERPPRSRSNCPCIFGGRGEAVSAFRQGRFGIVKRPMAGPARRGGADHADSFGANSTKLLASAVPDRIKVASVVIPSLLLSPVSSVMAAITGASGAVWSTTTANIEAGWSSPWHPWRWR